MLILLILLIPIAWLAIVAFVIAICQAAARGDAKPAPVVEVSPSMPWPGLTVWKAPHPPAQLRRPLPGAGRTRSRRLSHGVR
jgi:hypothetical protein